MFFKHKRDSLHKASFFFPITNKNSHSFQPRTLQRKGVRMIYDTTMVIEWTKNHLSNRPGGIFSNQVGIRMHIWFGILSNLPSHTRNRDNSPDISKWGQIPTVPTDPICSSGPEKLDPSKGSALTFVACITMYYYVLLYTIANESIKEMSTNSQLPPSFVTPNCTSDIYYSRADERRWSDDSYSFC